jgi:peptidoglycan/xylan/chitin deacetylase (PgdA/CDA1 family)
MGLLHVAAAPAASNPLPDTSPTNTSVRLADRSQVALTFDDSPHPEATPRVLDVLSERGAKATFFLVGKQVARRPHLAAEIARQGHAIGAHGYRNLVVCCQSERELIEDLEKAAYIIASASGCQANLYRPPSWGLHLSGAWGDPTPRITSGALGGGRPGLAQSG